MADKKLSQLTTTTDASNLWLPGYDLTRAVGDQNVKISSGVLFAALQAGSRQNGGSGFITQYTPSGITVAPNSYSDYQVYTPTSTNTDVLIFSLQISGVSIAAPIYNLKIYAGQPSLTSSVLLYDQHRSTNLFVGDDGNNNYNLPHLVYVPIAYGTNEIWVRLESQQNTTITVFAQIVACEFVGNGEIIPSWQPPPQYTGPLLNTVYVGPTEQFVEPQFGIQALADGGTMYIDGGIYYLPFGFIPPGSIYAPYPATTYTGPYKPGAGWGLNPNDPNNGARFIQGATVIGNGTYGTNPTIFNGRGGFGLPTAPASFRLQGGKGFVYTESPLSISNVQFYQCGGFDQQSDGEAGVYVGGAPTVNGTIQPSIVNVSYCAFEKCEDGIFTQGWFHVEPVAPANADGPCRTVTLNIDHCDFGYTAPNGGAGDGYSSDIYSECMTTNVSNCNFYGDLTPLPWRGYQDVPNPNYNIPAGAVSTSGNLVKSRCAYLNVSNCWLRNQSGKWIDQPQAGVGTVTNCTFQSLPGVVNLVWGYNTEHQNSLQPMASVAINSCTFYISRFETLFWNNSLDTTNIFDFQNCTFYYTNTGASLVFNRTGSAYSIDPTVAPNAPTTYTSSITIAPHPVAPHPSSFAGDPSPFSPLNP